MDKGLAPKEVKPYNFEEDEMEFLKSQQQEFSPEEILMMKNEMKL